MFHKTLSHPYIRNDSFLFLERTASKRQGKNFLVSIRSVSFLSNCHKAYRRLRVAVVTA